MGVAILIAFWSAVCMAVSHHTAWEIWMSWERPVAEASSAAHIAAGIRGARTWSAVVTSPLKCRARDPSLDFALEKPSARQPETQLGSGQSGFRSQWYKSGGR